MSLLSWIALVLFIGVPACIGYVTTAFFAMIVIGSSIEERRSQRLRFIETGGEPILAYVAKIQRTNKVKYKTAVRIARSKDPELVYKALRQMDA